MGQEWAWKINASNMTIQWSRLDAQSMPIPDFEAPKPISRVDTDVNPASTSSRSETPNRPRIGCNSTPNRPQVDLRLECTLPGLRVPPLRKD